MRNITFVDKNFKNVKKISFDFKLEFQIGNHFKRNSFVNQIKKKNKNKNKIK